MSDYIANIFVLPCKDLGLWQQERNLIEKELQERAFLLQQERELEQEKSEWESRFEVPSPPRDYNSKLRLVKKMEKRAEQIIGNSQVLLIERF